MIAMSRPAWLILISVSLSPVPAIGAQPETIRRGVAPPPARAQEIERPGDSRIVLPGGNENARETRERLARLFGQYPPTLAEVLQRDPTLLRNEAYLAPYPELAAFLAQHPEVAHNPSFFLGFPQRNPYSGDPSIERARVVSGMFQSFTMMAGFMSFFALLGWVIKTLMDSRRWARASKIQTEAHVKVIDRLTSNEDLLAYVQTPAGRRYLESAPLALDPREGITNAPLTRILWSVQAGIVAAFIGLGFLFVSAKWAGDTEWSGDFARMLFMAGVVALAAGAGFVLSGFASYALSRRFGLINTISSSNA
jgi:hypothetical protein